jgi:adenylate cyclase class 2
VTNFRCAILGYQGADKGMVHSLKELEVKLLLADLEQLNGKLESLGAKMVQLRTYERNLRFDTPEETLTQSSQLLRLRQDHANRLTYKGPSENIDGVSARTEIEFTVGNFENAQELLEALGYQISMIYEKYRTVYELESTLITLDEMPFGNFAEIEGSDGATIQAVCSRLGLNWEVRTLQSYAELFQAVKKNLNLKIRDLTFENFSAFHIRPEHLEMTPADIE